MIRIVKGIYGYKEPSGRIIPKSRKSDPFELSKEREKELVEGGIAEYVQEPEEPVPVQAEPEKPAPKKAAKKPAKKEKEPEEQPELEAADPE